MLKNFNGFSQGEKSRNIILKMIFYFLYFTKKASSKMTEQRKSGLKKARSGDMSIFMDEVSNALVNNKNASEIYLAYEKYLIKHGCVPELIEPEFTNW